MTIFDTKINVYKCAKYSSTFQEQADIIIQNIGICIQNTHNRVLQKNNYTALINLKRIKFNDLIDDFTVSPFSGAGEESLLITGWSFESRGNHANLIDSSMWDCKNQPIINKGLPHDSNDQPVINKDSSPAPLNGSNREVA